MGGGEEDGLVTNGNDNNEEEIKMNMGRKRKVELDPETMKHVRKAAEIAARACINTQHQTACTAKVHQRGRPHHAMATHNKARAT